MVWKILQDKAIGKSLLREALFCYQIVNVFSLLKLYESFLAEKRGKIILCYRIATVQNFPLHGKLIISRKEAVREEREGE